MRKNYVKTIALVLVTAMLLVFLAACNTETPITSSSHLNDIKITDFSIVYAADTYGYNQRAAQYIQTEIASRTGQTLPLLTDADPAATTYEIIVGDTTREISSRIEPISDSVKFNILAEDTQIAMEGEYFVIAAAAYYFVNTYIPQNNYDAVIPKEVTTHDPIVEAPDNYIMLIGDGMGPNQTLLFNSLANNIEFGHGEDTFFGYYLPYLGAHRTGSLTGVTDSAAGGTALACGIKTINYYVGQDQNHAPVQSLTELAASLGLATAVMSTEVNTGATPAAFSAHANDRDDKADIIMSQSELKKATGTIIECGYDYYNFNGVRNICNKVNNTLTTLTQDPDGFFLMYEEAHGDKHGHNNDLEKCYAAMVRFNRVIAVVMEYAFYHPNTFVIITADHETGGLMKSDSGFYYTSEDHTGVDVLTFAYGIGGELFHHKTIENIQIPQTIASFWGVDDFGDQSQFQPLTK